VHAGKVVMRRLRIARVILDLAPKIVRKNSGLVGARATA